MESTHRMARIQLNADANPCIGRVHYAPGKSAWISLMVIGAVLGGALNFSWAAFGLFASTSMLTLCLGHSAGMHRRLIHNSFDCPRWLEYLLVYCGTLIGMAGPFSIIETHELRDWAQRQPVCHDYFASRQPLLKDAFWILHCDIRLQHSPRVVYEERIRGDRFYHFLEKTRHWQQLPWAILFYALGGWSWVFWGICARVSVCMIGHWLVGYFAHRFGDSTWHIEGAGCQGYNVTALGSLLGLLSVGECWHNNHHAFPDSAQLGLSWDQPDPSWWFICSLKKLGLAWNLQTAANQPPRPERVRLEQPKSQVAFLQQKL